MSRILGRFGRRHLCLTAALSSALYLSVIPCSEEGASCDSRTGTGRSERNNSALYRNFVADAIEKAAPAVVNLKCEYHPTPFLRGVSSGSGFVVTPDGFIATNAHVVGNGPNALQNKVLVTFWSGERRMATVHSMDAASDIALVKLDEITESLPCVTFGESASLRAGEFVVALGSPLTLKNTATYGIVSSASRHGVELGISKSRQEWIQTDAAINQGNSGGPLLNLDGEVVGINSMKVANTDGVSFAIPIDNARIIMGQLMTRGRVIRPQLGIKLEERDLNSATKSSKIGGKGSVAFSEEVAVVVTGIDQRSLAAQSGLKIGDVVVEVDDVKVRGITDVLSAIGLEVGKTIRLRVRRGSDSNTFPVNITSVPEGG